eukprot:8485640-Alexandrium_andersonii.AAC.1
MVAGEPAGARAAPARAGAGRASLGAGAPRVRGVQACARVGAAAHSAYGAAGRQLGQPLPPRAARGGRRQGA